MSAISPQQEGGHVAGVDVVEAKSRRIVHRDKQRDEPVARRVTGHLYVQPRGKVGDIARWLVRGFDQRPKHRQQQRHEQRRRAAFAGDIAECHDQPAIGQSDDIEEVTTDGVGGAAEANGFDGGRAVQAVRQHGQLDVARDLRDRS